MPEFKDKLVLVTGAARGLGRGMAIEYGKLGAQLIITDILGDQLDQTAADLKKEGFSVHSFQCDLSSDSAVEALGNEVKQNIGVPDILHNNAMYAPHGTVENIDIEGTRKAFEINVLGYMRIVKAFLTEMITRRSGWVVNTASPNGIAPPAAFAVNGIPYNLTKAAEISLSQSLAATLKQYNIGVTVLYPGAVWTGASTKPHGTASKEFEIALHHFFLARAIKPEEAAQALLAGVKEGKFLVTNFKNFEKVLVEFAQNGMDPNAEYSWE
jgi:NAD(P)-dependent dehydrogenase (short-subunit alcohol dehydrogenase family)